MSSANEARGDVFSTIVGALHRLEVFAIVVADLVTLHKYRGISLLQRHDTEPSNCGDECVFG